MNRKRIDGVILKLYKSVEKSSRHIEKQEEKLTVLNNLRYSAIQVTKGEYEMKIRKSTF